MGAGTEIEVNPKDWTIIHLKILASTKNMHLVIVFYFFFIFFVSRTNTMIFTLT